MKAEALIGTVLGTCTLQRLIGRGGLGAVYLAQQSHPRRHVAVKVFLPASEFKAEQLSTFLQRFQRETDIAALLDHPNILPVYESGEQNGLPYLVMPYIGGGTLQDVLKRQGALPLTEVVDYLEQLAAALEYAHEQNIIHRDIKPANILLATGGRLLLSDFGLGKVMAESQIVQARLTGPGAAMGTPDYMAPEQILGGKVSGSTDIYSLGVILYQMVTGVLPFQAESPVQVAVKHLRMPPPAPRLHHPDLPGGAEQVILRALAKRAMDRYAHAQDLAAAFVLALTVAGIQLDVQQHSTGNNVASVGARLSAPASGTDTHEEVSPGGISPNRDAGVMAAGNELLPSSPESQRSSNGRSEVALSVGNETSQSKATQVLTKMEEAHQVLQTAGTASYKKYTLRREEEPEALEMQSGGDALNPVEARFSGPWGGVDAMPTDPSLQLNAVEQIEFESVGVGERASWGVGTKDSEFVLAEASLVGGPTLSSDGNDPFHYSNSNQHPAASVSTGVLQFPGPSPATTRALPTEQLEFEPPAMVGGFPAGVQSKSTPPPETPVGYNPISPLPNTSGTLPIPNAAPGTIKLSAPVKVVQLPIAGQPGRFVTGLLPVLPEAKPPSAAETFLQRHMNIISALVISLFLLTFGTGAFLFISTHVQAPRHKVPPSINGNPDVKATATARAIATANAGIILFDPLSSNIHNWTAATTGSKLYVFENGAYHITDNDPREGAPAILPDENLTQPFGYTLTMEEIRGNDTSVNNAFGMILRANISNSGGKTITKFYSFEVVNKKGGEYQFWKYDNSQRSTPWKELWHHPFGGEFHVGHGPASANTIKIFANGKNFTFIVNGKQIANVQDNSIAAGGVGMLVNLIGTEVAFSNLKLTYN